MGQAKPIPDRFRTITPHLVVREARKAIEFYKQAFGAEACECMPGPDGKTVMHAELKIGDSMLMICDEFPGMENFKAPQSLNGTTVGIHLYVSDVDKAFQRAVDAGATASMPVMDTFWGDRYGKVTDPFGHEWSIATHMKDLTLEEIKKGADEFFANMGKDGCCEK